MFQKLELLKDLPPNPNKEKKMNELKTTLLKTQKEQFGLLNPFEVYKEFVSALNTSPNVVIIAGDGVYPKAEKHIDLLAVLFRLVPTDDVQISWCEEGTLHRRMWSFISDSISRSGISSACERKQGRLPSMTDVKGPKPSSPYHIEEHHRWHRRGCSKFANSVIGKGLPLFASSPHSGVRRSMWLSDNLEMFGTKTIAALISEGGETCGTNDPYRIEPSLRLGGVCIHEQYLDRGRFPSYLLREMPCGRAM